MCNCYCGAHDESHAVRASMSLWRVAADENTHPRGYGLATPDNDISRYLSTSDGRPEQGGGSAIIGATSQQCVCGVRVWYVEVLISLSLSKCRVHIVSRVGDECLSPLLSVLYSGELL